MKLRCSSLVLLSINRPLAYARMKRFRSAEVETIPPDAHTCEGLITPVVSTGGAGGAMS
jgi:hypothetical protein